MAPLTDDHTVFQQQHTWVRAYDGLQRGLISEAERVFRSCDVLPTDDAVPTAGCKTVERIAVVLTVLVDPVQIIEVRVIGLFQMRRYQQEGVACLLQHLLSDVLTIFRTLDEEVCIRHILTIHHPLPALTQVCTDVIGAEVELGQGIETATSDDHEDEER